MRKSSATAPSRWVKAHTADLLRYASARVKEKAVAEDLVQLTFVAAWGDHGPLRRG
ncbi:MAG: hypothetical protein IPI07_02920 [Flavobacteriales bacterium]|nr:hypothetical protein [Flavobacteriales bacterium]